MRGKTGFFVLRKLAGSSFLLREAVNQYIETCDWSAELQKVHGFFLHGRACSLKSRPGVGLHPLIWAYGLPRSFYVKSCVSCSRTAFPASDSQYLLKTLLLLVGQYVLSQHWYPTLRLTLSHLGILFNDSYFTFFQKCPYICNHVSYYKLYAVIQIST